MEGMDGMGMDGMGIEMKRYMDYNLIKLLRTCRS
jgi:hypothetical protein